MALANAWLLASPASIFPIVGISKLEQLDQALPATEVDLTPQEADEIAAWFGTEPKEEEGGNFPSLRRQFDLVK